MRDSTNILQWHFLTGNHPVRFKGLWIQAWFHIKPLCRPPGSWRTAGWRRGSKSRADMGLQQWGIIWFYTKNNWISRGTDVIGARKSYKKDLTHHAHTAGKTSRKRYSIQKVKASINRRPPFDVQNKTISFMRMGDEGVTVRVLHWTLLRSVSLGQRCCFNGVRREGTGRDSRGKE